MAVFTPLSPLPGVQAFVASYRAHTGLMPTQRSFFVYEGVLLAVDAIRRAGTDTPDAIEAALQTTAMPSLLGGTYAPDGHNHPHTPLSILGTDGWQAGGDRDGVASVRAGCSAGRGSVGAVPCQKEARAETDGRLAA